VAELFARYRDRLRQMIRLRLDRRLHGRRGCAHLRHHPPDGRFPDPGRDRSPIAPGHRTGRRFFARISGNTSQKDRVPDRAGGEVLTSL